MSHSTLNAHRSRMTTKLYSGECLGSYERTKAHIQKHRLHRVFGNVFAERLILSLRKVDDPGTRVVISTLAFKITPDDDEGSSDAELSEGTDDVPEFRDHGSDPFTERDEADVKEKGVHTLRA